MRKKREGYYVVTEFTAEPKASAELDRFLVLADEVLRHKIVRLPDKVAGRTRSKAPAAAKPATADGAGPGAG
jgi:small subunit ribosomal protein S6